MAPPTSQSSIDLGALFELHGRRLLRLARRLAAAEAEDLVQETFVRAAERGGLPPDAAGCEAWLVRVLINLARDRERRARVRRRARPLLGQADLAPDDPASRTAARLDIAAALACLAPRRRAVVLLRELEDLDTSDIARLLGIRRVTVRWHLAAGRAELARRLGLGEPNEEKQR